MVLIRLKLKQGFFRNPVAASAWLIAGCAPPVCCWAGSGTDSCMFCRQVSGRRSAVRLALVPIVVCFADRCLAAGLLLGWLWYR